MDSTMNCIIGGVIGLIIGSVICLLLGRWAYNRQYNREKRAEKIKRELDEEDRTRRLLHPYWRIYKVDGGKGQIISDRMTCPCYLASAKEDEYNVELTFIVQKEDLKK